MSHSVSQDLFLLFFFSFLPIPFCKVDALEHHLKEDLGSLGDPQSIGSKRDLLATCALLKSGELVRKNTKVAVEEHPPAPEVFRMASSLWMPDMTSSNNNNKKTQIHFVPSNAFDVAIFLAQTHKLSPVVVVAGHASLVGSNFVHSSSSEQELFCRSNVLAALAGLSEPYRLPPDGGMYFPRLQLLLASRRSPQSEGSSLISSFASRRPVAADEPLHFAAILASPPAAPPYEARHHLFRLKHEEDHQLLLAKISACFATALSHGHNAVVFSSFASSGTPPQIFASYVRQVLSMSKFAKCFSHVVFAIADYEQEFTGSPHGTLEAIRGQFNVTSKFCALQ